MRSLLFVCLSMLAACQTLPLPPLPAWQKSGGAEAGPGAIRDLRSGARLTPAQLLERLAAADGLGCGDELKALRARQTFRIDDGDV